jgi:hypothetical protein
MLTNPNTGDCQVGYMDNNDCLYHTYIEDSCLGWDINHPIHKIVHKITNTVLNTSKATRPVIRIRSEMASAAMVWPKSS